jgi:hypothetical protein
MCGTNNIQGYRSILYMNESWHGELLCMWSSSEQMFNMRSSNLMDLLHMKHKVVNCHITCHLWSLRNSFIFQLQLLNSVWVGVVHTIFEVASIEIITRIHVHYENGVLDHTWSALEISSTGQSYQHIMQNIHDDICCMWACTILLEKCVHMTCCLNDWNNLIMQLLQV